MFYFLAVPFALQGLAILVDEFYFHRRRGLPIWERWGHPLDTLSLLICWLFLLCLPYFLCFSFFLTDLFFSPFSALNS